jgi:hypothetical protein
VDPRGDRKVPTVTTSSVSRKNRSSNEELGKAPMRKITNILLAANLCLWLYFWFGFAQAAEPYNPRPFGHLPLDPYSFWGHAIGLGTSSLSYPFMKVVFWPNLPSFFVVALIRNIFFRNIGSDSIYVGISIGGYFLLLTMMISFAQWYLVGRICKKLLDRTSGNSRGHSRDTSNEVGRVKKD